MQTRRVNPSETHTHTQSREDHTLLTVLLIAHYQRLVSNDIFPINLLTRSLFQPIRPLKATVPTSQPVLSMSQIETIFYKIQDIFEIHKEFYDALLPNIQQWDEKVTVGHLFQKLVRNYSVWRFAGRVSTLSLFSTLWIILLNVSLCTSECAAVSLAWGHRALPLCCILERLYYLNSVVARSLLCVWMLVMMVLDYTGTHACIQCERICRWTLTELQNKTRSVLLFVIVFIWGCDQTDAFSQCKILIWHLFSHSLLDL